MRLPRPAALLLVSVFVFGGCASNGGPRPLYCGLGGMLLGAGAGVVTQGEIHDWDDASSATLGAGAAIGAVAGWVLGAGICWALYEPEEEVAEVAPEPEPEPEPPPPPPPPEPEVREKIVLRGVNFDFDRATIRPDAAVVLDEAANLLEQNPDVHVNVDGHTDATGPEAYNQTLSERRAAAVAEYLALQGVDRERLTSRGFGESNPLANNDTRDGRAQNRRVELLVSE